MSAISILSACQLWSNSSEHPKRNSNKVIYEIDEQLCIVAEKMELIQDDRMTSLIFK